MPGPATWWLGAQWRTWNWTASSERWDAFRWSGQATDVLRDLPAKTKVLIMSDEWENDGDYRLWATGPWGVSLAQGLHSVLPLSDGVELQVRATGPGADDAILHLQRLLGHSLRKADRIRGGVWGLATGDALGVPLIGRDRNFLRQHPVKGPTFGGMYGQPPGTWGTATSTALIALDALRAGYRERDYLMRLHRWAFLGERTARGGAFNADVSLAHAAQGFVEHPWGQTWAGDELDALPLTGALATALWMADRPDKEVAKQAMAVCCTTHRALVVQQACAWLAVIARAMLDGLDIQQATSRAGSLLEANTHPALHRLAKGSVFDLRARDIDTTGNATQMLEAVLWCLSWNETFPDCALAAAHLGDNTDVVGALVGGLAGIRDGDWGIPDGWRTGLLGRDHLIDAIIHLLAQTRP